MQALYKILIRFGLALAAFFIMNAAYERFFLERDIQRHSVVINLVREMPEETQIVYIGESSNNSFRSDDLDKRAISDFIADHFPSKSSYGITKPASHAGIYKTLLRHIPKYSNVETLIVTLNLRSFNAQWIYSDLETPLQKSMVLLRERPALVNRFALSFKAYDSKTPEERERQFKKKWERDQFDFPYDFPFADVREWDGHMWHNGIKNSDGTKNEEQTILACHYIKAYAFQIDTLNNPRIHDFNSIVELARERGWNLVFNLLAENTQKAKELVGDDLIYLMDFNRNLLIDYYTQKEVLVVDNLHGVGNDQFIDQDWTTEHYAEKGRKQIAGKVAKEMKALYPHEYVQKEYKDLIQTEFFNGCEGDVIWGQMQTCTDELAYSGKYSSKMDKEKIYSVSFEYPMQKIPDTCKNEIQIALKYHSKDTSELGSVVIEAPGIWHGVPLSSQRKLENGWHEFLHSMLMPEELKKSEIIKIYVFKESQTILFIDDFEIVFR